MSEYITNDTNSKQFAHKLAVYLQNRYNNETYNINKYKNFNDSNYDGKVVIDKSAVHYDSSNYRVGPFTLTNKYGFLVKLDQVKIANSEIESYKIVDENGNEINLSTADENNRSFYIKFENDIREEYSTQSISVNYTIDYGEVPIATIFIPTTSGDNPQALIDISRTHKIENDSWNETIEGINPDIALKKYIYKINDTIIENRLGDIDTSTISESNTNATYNMNKTPISTNIGDTVTYVIQLFNEGNVDGRASKIVDYLPDGLTATRVYGNDKEVQFSTYASGKAIVFENPYADYIQAFNGENGEEFKNKSQKIYVECKIDKLYKGTYTNVAEILEYDFENGTDIDSQPKNWNIDGRSEYDKGNNPTDRQSDTWKDYSNNQDDKLDNQQHPFIGQEDDDDFEKIKVNYLDLALTKSIAWKYDENNELKELTANEKTKNSLNIEGKESVINEEANDLTYKMNKVAAEVFIGDKVISSIKVYNEGKVEGVVKEITDYLPTGLEFLREETKELNGNEDYNFTYDVTNNNVTITVKDANGKTLNPFVDSNQEPDYIEVKLVCKVTDEASGILYNSAAITNYGYMTNSGDYVQAESKGIDIDSYQVTLRNNLRTRHINNYTQATTNLDDIAKNDLQYEDDDDVDAIKVEYKPQFDLALRKYISATIAEDGTVNESYITKVPNITQNSLNVLNREGTAEYYHDKCLYRDDGFIQVGYGEKVLYKIRVYNEGSAQDYAGRATEITDYLPEQLKYVELAEGYENDWSAEEIENENKVIITYNGDKIIQPDTLKNLIDNKNNDEYYQEVGIICEVVAKSAGVITNRAAITGDQAYNSDGIAIEYDNNGNEIKDRDSHPEDLSNPNLENWYKNTVINPDTPESYYPGEEDDDDFDTVYVNEYKLEINKKDQENNLLTGTDFEVIKYRYYPYTSTNPIKQKETLTKVSEDINKSGTGSEMLTLPSWCNYAFTMNEDRIIIKEIKSDVSHINMLEGKYIKFGVAPDASVWTDINIEDTNIQQKGFEIYYDNGDDDYENDELVNYDTSDTNSIYNFIEIKSPSINGNKTEYTENEVIINITNPTETTEIPVEKVWEGIDEEEANKYQVTFTLYDRETEVDSLTIVGNGTDTFTNLEKKDTYTVEETKIVKDINNDGAFDENDTVLANSAEEAEKYIKGQETVEGTIVIKNELPTESGEYKIELIKKGTDGKQLGGVKFTASAIINGESKTLNTEQNPLTTSATEAVAVGNTVTINKEKVETADTYTLREYDIGDNEGYFMGIDKDIVLKVKKKSETSSDGRTITNSVTGIELAIEGATATNNGTSSTITLSNGSKVTATLAGNTITITVENPEVTEEGKYNVKLIKNVTDGTPLAGVEFTAKAVINGAEEKDLYTNENPLKTAMTPVTVVDAVTIDKEKVETPDQYTLKEINIGDNEGYYIGITQDIVITINKKSEVSLDKSTITNSVRGIELYIKGINVEKNSETKSTAKTTINGEEVEVIVELVGDTITVTVENPTVKEDGKYNVKLVKKGIDEKRLGGVEFTAKAAINGEAEQDINTKQNPLITNEQTPVNVGETVTIDRQSINIPDKYTLKEINIGENKGYYIGILQDIVVTVNKKSELSSDKSTITNSVSGIELELQGANVTKNSETKSTAKITVDGQELEVIAELNGSTITLTVENPVVTGEFDLDLIKYVKGTTIPLAGAEFKVSVKDENETELADVNKTYTTGNDGHFTEKLSKIDIDGENKKYTVTITETKVPEGYEGISGSITFNVTSKLSNDGKSYVLVAGTPTTATNAKKVTVTESQVLIEAENTPEGPHKGVKEVNNQDSGYYDEVKGAVYKDKEELESTLHDWVITSRIPSGINQYAKYIITDPIDERLDFTGIENVKVVLLDGETLEEKETLTSNKDYKVNYDEETRTLKVSFIEDDFKAGQELEEGSIVEIRFNTTFAKDEDGNIIAINQLVENKATLTYGDNSGNEVSKDTETPEVHTGGVGLYKYDVKTGKALEGAKFKVATSEENAENGIFVKDANGNDIEKITNEKGIAVFEGLEFGEDAMDEVKYQTGEDIYGKPVYKYDWEKVETTYYIVETEAPTGYSKIEEPIEAVVKKDNYDITDIETLIKVGNESNIYDLALRKFITAVKDGATGEENEITTRIPDVDIANLVDGTSTTATYTHSKDPVLVHTTDTVTYTIRIFNEGPQDAYASLVKDDIPEGAEFITYTDGDGSINSKYRWKMVDENNTEVTDPAKAKYIITDYLAQDTEEKNLIKGFNKDTMQELDYRDVQVQFKVVEPTKSNRIIINEAQISEETDKEGNPVKDRDSTPNEWIEGEDDQDIEKVRVLYFDLELRKWVTQAIVTENGQTVVTETGHKAEDNPETVVKVDLKKSKLNNVTVKFRYSIRITNRGEIAGEATEIRDDIPNGLNFVAEDNPDWREEDGQIVTNKLANTTLQPGESAEVEIVLTWVNSEDNMGVMVNTAEINEDHNAYGTPDIDSTPGNNVPGEDDIDDAPVMLTIKTGSEIIMYTTLGLGVVAIIGAGVVAIKKRVLIK